MSLINDALKRAKEAQQQAAPPPAQTLEFRPIESAQQPQPSRGLMLPAMLAAAALLILLLAWQWSQRTNSAAPIVVSGRTAVSAPVPPAPQPAVVTAAPAPVAPVPAVQPVPEVSSVPPTPPMSEPVGPVEPMAVSNSTNAPVAAVSDSGTTNTLAVVEPAAPKPPPIKLQAIVFSRTRPCVMINGRTLFIGDKLNGSRVTAIDQESVTLVGAAQTNVLTLQTE